MFVIFGACGAEKWQVQCLERDCAERFEALAIADHWLEVYNDAAVAVGNTEDIDDLVWKSKGYVRIAIEDELCAAVDAVVFPHKL